MSNRISIAGMFIGLCVLYLASTVVAQEGMSRKQVIQALEKGIVALQTIDRPKDARHLTNILQRYLDPHAQSEGRNNQEQKREEDRRTGEREIGQQHVEHMLMALEGLIAAEKMDAAESLEKAIRARRLRLEGADNKEAERFIAESPTRSQQIELLVYAAKFLKEQGKTDRADVVAKLAETLRRPNDRKRQEASERQRRAYERHVHEQRRERAQTRERVQAELHTRRQEIQDDIATHETMMADLEAETHKRMEHLHQRMQELRKVNEALRDQLRQLEADRMNHLETLNAELSDRLDAMENRQLKRDR